MPDVGKNAPGLRGFPTPNTAADTFAYLLFYFNDPVWAQYLLGAARTLTDVYNWYEAGDMSPDDAAEAFRQIVQDAPYNVLPSADECILPDGGRLLRLGAAGHTEMQDGSNWIEPDGDYTVPPVPARSGGTSEDQVCLAASNAAFVLQQLYEQLSDDWNAGLATAEAIADAVTLIGGLIAAPIGLAAESLIVIGRLVFQVVYETVAFVGADVWTGDFTHALTCVLQACATNAAGVVTFDYDCVLSQLASITNVFDLSISQLRLFGQLAYILSWIGADGLNLAGATTAITTPDCTDCEWCYTFRFTESDGGFSVIAGNGGQYNAGVGWGTSDVFTGGTYRRTVAIELSFASATFSEIALSFVFAPGSYSTTVTKQAIQNQAGTLLAGGTALPATGDNTLRATGAITASGVRLFVTSSSQGSPVYSGSANIYQVTFRGVGFNPFGESNCT